MPNLISFQSPTQVERALTTLVELRPHLTLKELSSLYQSAHTENGYRLVGYVENEECIAVMGYRVLYDFVHGKHLYIDDLVVAKPFQSRGLGASLLREAESLAKEIGCRGLRLCTGKDNHGAIRFYEREGWNPRAFAFKKEVPKISTT